jgi:murein DD-endopeptidase MepM/ murein hydrolase activator NlpD/endonuclease/exonuclease/phosphatase (EEP) superfamily protein YafD
MSWRGAGFAAGAAICGGLLLAPGILMVMVMTGARTELPGGGCGRSVSADGDLVSSDELSKAQLANAAAIVRVGLELRIPRRGIVVALAAAHQESGFLNYANDGRGGDLRADQAGIGRSQGIAHQAVGTDHGSLGVFQQQWPWWGPMTELMSPGTAAEKFYRSLVAVPGWETMPVTRAAQAVQRSAFPDAYADDEALAEDLLDDPGLASGSASQAVWTGSDSGSLCDSTDVVDGPVASPLARTVPFTDLHNFGHSGGRWAHGHTGTDLSTPCGTPVRAATAGTVVIETDQSWAGPWLVKVSTGEGRLTTWYAHMQSLDVVDGQSVQAGQQIGKVGSLGNATGCHLHFEVHPRGGSIYEDGVNPSEWLQTHVGAGGQQVQTVSSASSTAGSSTTTPSIPGSSTSGSSGSGSFVLATFNVLGNSHTARGGHHSWWATGAARMKGAIDLLDRYDAEVVGLQELQRSQRQALVRLAGDRYAVYSPPGDTENSIAWRRDRWSFVSADTVPIPYFHGNIRDMPVVRLRNLATQGDAIFVNVHNPADVHGSAGRFRAEAVRRELTIMRSLARYDVPAFLTGDFNARTEAFCALTAGGTLTASAGGSHAGRCQPPRHSGIDWIFATRQSTWTGHSAVPTPKRAAISDHPLIVARLSIGGGR